LQSDYGRLGKLDGAGILWSILSPPFFLLHELFVRNNGNGYACVLLTPDPVR
jgi:hypothetical protein